MSELKSIIEGVNKYQIPDHLIDSIIEYVFNGRPCGGFLESVFSNDLTQAYGRADHKSMQGIPEIVKWLYNTAPRGCWGSKENYKLWVADGGLKGL